MTDCNYSYCISCGGEKAVIESNLIGPLINLLQNADFDVKKEAAWAVSNATSGGSHEQIKYVQRLFFFGIILGIFIDVRCPCICF